MQSDSLEPEGRTIGSIRKVRLQINDRHSLKGKQNSAYRLDYCLRTLFIPMFLAEGIIVWSERYTNLSDTMYGR